MVRISRVLLAAALVLSVALGGGCSGEGAPVQSWWGPLHVDGDFTFSAGDPFNVQGFAYRTQTGSVPLRDLVGISLVSGQGPTTCSVYARYLERVSEVQAYLDDLLETPEAERPPVNEWSHYVCQNLEAASVEAFGGEGAYRSIEILIDVSGGGYDGLFRGAPPGDEPPRFLGADLLSPGTFVSRVYERSKHGEGILPDAAEGAWLDDDMDPVTGCPGMVSQLVAEYEEGRETYPDSDSLALSGTSHRYYHLYKSDESVALSGNSLDLGVLLGDWDVVAASGGALQLTVFHQVARAPDTFPYPELLLSSKGLAVPIEACADISPFMPLLWPEVDELQAGDDDDAVDDDDVGDDDSVDDDDSADAGDDDDDSGG